MPIRVTRIYLRWYRDKGLGQKAVDEIPGIQEKHDGSWPIAEWDCDSYTEAAARWLYLLKRYEVNANTWTDFAFEEPPKSKFF